MTLFAYLACNSKNFLFDLFDVGTDKRLTTAQFCHLLHMRHCFWIFPHTKPKALYAAAFKCHQHCFKLFLLLFVKLECICCGICSEDEVASAGRLYLTQR